MIKKTCDFSLKKLKKVSSTENLSQETPSCNEVLPTARQLIREKCHVGVSGTQILYKIAFPVVSEYLVILSISLG